MIFKGQGNLFTYTQHIDVQTTKLLTYIVYASLRLKNRTPPPRVLKVRDYRKLNDDQFKSDLESAPFRIASIFYDSDDYLWAWESLFCKMFLIYCICSLYSMSSLVYRPLCNTFHSAIAIHMLPTGSRNSASG